MSDLAKDLKTLGLHYVASHVSDVIDLATAHGLHPCLTTNGLLLDEGLARELGRRSLVWINVSLDGATAYFASNRAGGRGDAAQARSNRHATGSVIRERDIDSLRKLVADTGIFIISDEVYEHLIYDGIPHLSMLRYPDLLERSFVCFSFGKTYHCTGWKLGYCIAPAAMTAEFRKVDRKSVV